jgi:hypothetical protein
MTNQVEGDDPVESVRKMAAMAKKGGSLTALGLVLFVCGELIGEFAALPDIP